VVAGLLAVTLSGAHTLWPYLALATATGAAAAFGVPAARAMPPDLVAVDLLASAMALRAVAFQTASVGGPALGGLLFAISLDLFAVLFGGAVALLPLYARSILHTGPLGLGILRSGPSIGAVVAGILLARKPLKGRAGRTLLVCVGAFGASIVVFGLSRWFLLSLGALVVSGYVDMFSVNIRSTTIALAAPNLLRGRVNAVENVFIGASNELGSFESGLAAALLGAAPAVVGGGLVTIGLALVWGRLFPSLARVDRLEDVRPEGEYATA